MAVSARTPSVSAAGLSVALRLQMQLPGQGKIRTSALNGHIPPEPTNIKALYFFLIIIFVVLRCLSRNAWKYIMALTLTGVRHLISPRWLEKM